MQKRKRLSFNDKLEACKMYERGEGSQRSVAKLFGISRGTFRDLYFKYINFGEEALKMQTKDRGYTKEFKKQVIEEYKSGTYSYTDLAIKYKIANSGVITSWVLGYNDINKTTYSGDGGVTIMARKTTLEERIEIIQYLIENELAYNKTSTHFNVSYQQVYLWYKKYKEKGVEGLVDKRGRKKQDYELSELELLRRENERLKKELELSRITEIVLKKKQEFEEEARLQELETKKRIKR